MKKNILKKSLLAITMMAMGTVALTSMTSCSKNESLTEKINKEESNLYAYWGERFSYLQGIWVKEEDKDEPSAGYIEVKSSNEVISYKFFGDYIRKCEIGNIIGNVNLIFFQGEYIGEHYYAKWADDTHSKLEMCDYNQYTGETDYTSKRYWIKLSKAPSGWD